MYRCIKTTFSIPTVIIFDTVQFGLQIKLNFMREFEEWITNAMWK